ncbi:MAG: CBS domain-containing protein [Anaerolineae bacterium]|nr:CBS domain-containing protein [Anaerolineae bacterium]
MLIGQCMQQNVITISPTTSHREAVQLLRDHNIRRLPVVSHGKLVGIVSEKDLLSSQPSPATTLSVYEIFALLDKMPVKQIMSQPVISVGPECTLEDAATIILTKKIGCLPVVKDQQLIGIITESDIFRLFVEVLGGNVPGSKFTIELSDTPGKLAEVCMAVANAGGNIISVTSLPTNDKQVREVTVKERGANTDVLREALHKLGAGVVEFHASIPYSPVMAE